MIALCIGRKEQGKTTLGYHLVAPVPQRVIFDPKEKFKTTDLIANGMDVYDALNDCQPEIIVYAGSYTTERFSEYSKDVNEWARQNRDKKFGFLVDEAGMALDDGIPEDFGSLLKTAPKDQARIVMTTWRAVEIPPLIRSQIDHWFIFKNLEPRDLEIIEERCGEEASALVQTLPLHAFVHVNDEHAERITKVVDDPSLWYVDIEKFQEANRDANVCR